MQSKDITYKAIISDFDGTLVNSDFKISQIVKVAIAKWLELGNKFSIITGKQYQGPIEEVSKELNLSSPIAVNSGARIINPKSREVYFEEFIPNNTVIDIIKILDKTKYFYEIQNPQNVYTKYKQLYKIQPHSNYKDLKNFKIGEVLKIRLVTTGLKDEVLSFVNDNIKNNFPGVNIDEGNTPYSTGIDITAMHINKQESVLRIANLLQIVPEEIIGIGDGINDYSLLAACGFKVAMENAPAELLKIADLIVPSYAGDGVAVLIDKVIQNKL